MKLTLIFFLSFFSFVVIGQSSLDVEESNNEVAVRISQTTTDSDYTYGMLLTNGRNEENVDSYGAYSQIYNDGSGSNNTYATYGYNDGFGSGNAYAGYFYSNVTSSMENAYGVYGRAIGAQNNFAGFFQGKIKIDNNTENINGVILDETKVYEHIVGDQVFTDETLEGELIISSHKNALESYGFYGDGDYLGMWSPGDGQPSRGIPNYTLLAIGDEDSFSGNDDIPWNGGALKYYLTAAGGWIASDINRKENIMNYESSLEKIKSLDVYTYNYKLNQEEVKKGQTNREIVGLLAQELQQAIPHAVEETEFGELFVNYNQVTSVLLGAVKELEAKVAELEAKLEEK